jgi:hypothetical protein
LFCFEKISLESESDARQAIEAFEKDKDLQKQMEDWRQTSKLKKDQPGAENAEDEEEASKVVERVMAEAALEEDEEDEGMDESIPAPPSKSLVRQLQRAIRLSESDKVRFVLFINEPGHRSWGPWGRIKVNKI